MEGSGLFGSEGFGNEKELDIPVAVNEDIDERQASLVVTMKTSDEEV